MLIQGAGELIGPEGMTTLIYILVGAKKLGVGCAAGYFMTE